MESQGCLRKADATSGRLHRSHIGTAAWQAWLGIAAATCLWVFCVTPVHATRPMLPSCDMRYPSFAPASLDAVLDMLRTADSGKSRCLVEQLPRFGESAVPPLAVLLRTGPEQGRRNAAAGLAALREQALSATPELEAALDDPSDQVRWWVLNALAVIEPRSPALTLHLLRRLDQATPGSLESGTLIYTISRMGSLPPKALPILAHALKRVPSYDRPAADKAIEAISHVAAPQRVVLLAQLVGDKDSWRAWRATLAIGRSGSFAVPVLLYRSVTAAGQRREAYRRAFDWAWTVASMPALSAYYQTDMTALMPQLRDPRLFNRVRAMLRLVDLAPAFAMPIPDGWRGDEENRIPLVRCDVLDALADGANRSPDRVERQAMASIAALMRRAAPQASCPIVIY